ncbi:MAG: NAD(P)/FAD-dependent oxidoreductase [Candidatus Hydrogenedentota bacterium]
MTRKHVLIVGCGFGGLACAEELASRADVEITVVDRRNHHLFQPLLYQVATAALSPGDIAQPIRSILRRHGNISVLLANADSVDSDRKTIHTSLGPMTWDYLVLAAGVAHSYFGRDDWAERAPGLKTLEDAVHIRSRFLAALEKAEATEDVFERARLLTFVIIGAGPTGVEMAGTMSEIIRTLLPREFRKIARENVRIILLEASARILTGFDPELSARAERQLRELGVEVRTGSRVTEITENAVFLGAEQIAVANVIWAAGVAASPIARSLRVALDKAGRVEVLKDLCVPGQKDIFVIGDLAAITGPDGRPVPGVAPAAIQMGHHAACSIIDDMEGRPRTPFFYKDKGSLATIGRAAAVAQIGGMKLSGFPAWLAWLVVHIYFLIGFHNKLFVMLEWFWAYIGFHPTNRLITYYDDEKS